MAFLILHFRIKQIHPIIDSAGQLKPFLPSSTFSALKTVAQRNRKEVYSQQSAPKENCTISLLSKLRDGAQPQPLDKSSFCKGEEKQRSHKCYFHIISYIKIFQY